jgi:hypothetical protein
MGKKRNEDRYYFRVQYQKGNFEISESISGCGYLSISKMIMTILTFVMKVKNEVGVEQGGKMALKGLEYIFKLCHNVDMDRKGTGASESTYISLNSAKDRTDRSERFDVEFLGLGGRDDLSNDVITRFIKCYKQIIRGQLQQQSITDKV